PCCGPGSSRSCGGRAPSILPRTSSRREAVDRETPTPNLPTSQGRRRAMRAGSILETIGRTPHVRINRLFGDAEVWIKQERANPKAEALAAGIEGSWIPQQFENQANVEVHRRTTAQEILNDFRDSPLDVLITGVGTGGHITGCAQVLKQEWPQLKVYAVEPA